MNDPQAFGPAPTLGRREALQRVAAFLGTSLSTSVLSAAGHGGHAARGNWTAHHLNHRQAEIVSRVAEHILPRTDTPGSGDVGVPQFIDLLYGEFMDLGERKTFSDGLMALYCQNFLAASDGGQREILQTIATGESGPLKDFLYQIREATLVGYFTSEQVGRNVLVYDPVPGRYEGCVPLSDTGGRAYMPNR